MEAPQEAEAAASGGSLCQDGEELKPGASEELILKAELTELASYDDSGVTGHKSCYVLEAGDYIFYVGTDVRSAREVGRATLSGAAGRPRRRYGNTGSGAGI